MQFVEVSGLRIAYRRRGRGAPIVLLHGGFSDSREWRSQIVHFAPTNDVIAWDAPGCGRSDDPPDGFGVDDYADVLGGFLRAVGAQRPHVVGLSFGAMCALALYRRHPRLPRSLTLASAYAGWGGSLPPEEVAERTRTSLAALDSPPHTWGREFLASVFSDTVRESVLRASMRIIGDVHPVGARRLVTAFGPADLSDVLPTIDVPTLLLYGERDRRSPVSIGRALQQQIAGSTLVILPGAGHGSNMEVPAQFSRAVQQFLQARGLNVQAARHDVAGPFS